MNAPVRGRGRAATRIEPGNTLDPDLAAVVAVAHLDEAVDEYVQGETSGET